MAVDIAQLLTFSVKNNASDLHLSSGVPPMIRVDGDVRRINEAIDALRGADVLIESVKPMRFSLEDILVKLKASGTGVAALQELLNSLQIEPVFTAHPTEPTRRTMLRKEQNIVRHLVEMLNPTMTPQETSAALSNIRLLITTGWQTEEHPSEQMTVADELEHVLFFLTDVLYRAVPPFYEDIRSAVDRIYGDDGRQIVIPSIIKFASWVGGDMDGNPNVNAKTIRATLARQRSLILDPPAAAGTGAWDGAGPA